MSTRPRSHSHAVKYERAHMHCLEAEALVESYVASHPYALRPLLQKDGEVMHELYFTEPTSSLLPIAIGDLVHNLRSGLNHLTALCTDRRNWHKVQFPIFSVDPFEIDPASQREREDRQRMRQRWHRFTSGLDDEAVAVIRKLQPFDAAPDDSSLHGLFILEELSNTDKHRELVVIASGIKDPELRFALPDGSESRAPFPGNFKDGAKVGPYPPEIDVRISGSPLVIVRVGEGDVLSGDMDLPGTLSTLMSSTVQAMQLLERFIRE